MCQPIDTLVLFAARTPAIVTLDRSLIDCHDWEKATHATVMGPGRLRAINKTEGIVLATDNHTAGLEITVDDGNQSSIVRLKGRLNIDSSPEFRDRLLAMLQSRSPKPVIIDLAEVSFIEASGIATL